MPHPSLGILNRAHLIANKIPITERSMIMEVAWRYFKASTPVAKACRDLDLSLQVQLPGYLRSLPLPKSIGGFTELTRDDWMTLLPFFLFLLVLLYLVFSPFFNMLSTRKQPRPKINRKQRMSESKVTNTVDIEDLANNEKTAFCRCWKSSKVIAFWIVARMVNVPISPVCMYAYMYCLELLVRICKKTNILDSHVNDVILLFASHSNTKK